MLPSPGDLLSGLPPAATIHNAFPAAQLEALQRPPTAAAAASWTRHSQTPLQGQGTPRDWGPRGREALLLDTVACSESLLSSCPLAQPAFSLMLTHILGDVGGASPPSGTCGPLAQAQKSTPSMSTPHGDIIPNDFSSHNRVEGGPGSPSSRAPLPLQPAHCFILWFCKNRE